MLKHDLKCGGARVPVGFAEFEVPGARPVDVFNTVMNVASQPDWNPKCNQMKHVGDWPEEGVRGWDNVFNLIFDKKLEFLVWQVSEADFVNEDFWMVTSTKHNGKLRQISPRQENWVESDNCLGAYHIRKSPNGTHVVITQHVNGAVGLWFPFHVILEVFPVAWKGMINFISQLSKASLNQSSLGWTARQTSVPTWMVPPETERYRMQGRANTTNGLPITFGESPIETATQQSWFRICLTAIFVICMLCFCIAIFGLMFFCNHPAWSSRVSETASQCSGKSDVGGLSDFDSEYSEYL